MATLPPGTPPSDSAEDEATFDAKQAAADLAEKRAALEAAQNEVLQQELLIAENTPPVETASFAQCVNAFHTGTKKAIKDRVKKK